MCDSFGNQCFYLTMNKDHTADTACSQCDYDCDNTQHTTSFVIRQTDPERFCANSVDYPMVEIKKYIKLHPFKKNPKLFYLKWKALVEGEEYQFNSTEHCYWKAKNDFAIVNVYLSTPSVPRMKQDVKHKFHDKLSLLGNYTIYSKMFCITMKFSYDFTFNCILGGILGLSCGFSILSIFEILFGMIRCCLNCLSGKMTNSRK